MNAEAHSLTLVGLQSLLDHLEVGETLTLATADSHRLFGLNDVAEGRIANFARGHGCRVDHQTTALTFLKADPADAVGTVARRQFPARKEHPPLLPEQTASPVGLVADQVEESQRGEFLSSRSSHETRDGG